MAGVLSYHCYRKASRRGQIYGVASNCIASAVFAVPVMITFCCTLMQHSLASPGGSPVILGASHYIDRITTTAAVLLPAAGLLLAMLSVASKKHRHEIAIMGLLVNVGALVAGVAFFVQQALAT